MIINNKESLIDIVYPIGSIYMSVNNVNPANFMGGAWVQLKDRFLLGAGDTYVNGEIGGDASHKLSIDEMPVHEHAFQGGSYTFLWGQTTTGGTNVYLQGATAVAGTTPGNSPMTNQNVWNCTHNRGGDAAHNNMPPYLVVYMWKRIS